MTLEADQTATVGGMASCPKISIIIAVWNGAKTLEACLSSICKQTYVNIELIVMDGGSTDGTVEILQRCNDCIDYWESAPDRGISHAWNKALARVTGDWVLFLGADDRLEEPATIERSSKILARLADRDVVFGRIRFDGGNYHGIEFGEQFNRRKFKIRMTIPHQAAFHNSRIFKAVGEFKESFKVTADYELLLRDPAFRIEYADILVSIMGGDGISSKMVSKALLEQLKAQLAHRTASRIRLFAMYYLFRARAFVASKARA